jgi:hypothetical protein
VHALHATAACACRLLAVRLLPLLLLLLLIVKPQRVA